jgi:hypothetical protein
MKIKWCRNWRVPRVYRLFDNDVAFDCGPLLFTWKDETPADIITVHPWRAIGYYGAGTIQSPRDMDEADALAWVSQFGNVAYVDREAGFIFYRPKE